jgi:PAS domain S-box-containing protein
VISSNEEARLAALDSYRIVGTPPEPSFDAIASFAAAICETEIALVSFHDRDQQWFKARVGTDLDSAPRADSFIEAADPAPAPLVVCDARADPRYARNPFVTGGTRIRFYAGQPLIDRDGHQLGVICVIDTKARPGGLTELQAQALRTIAEQVVAQLELRREVAQRAVAERAAAAARDRLALALDSAGEGHWDWNVASGEVWYSDQWHRIVGRAPGTVAPRLESWSEMVHPDDWPLALDAWEAHLAGETARIELAVRMCLPSGALRWVLLRGKVVERAPDGTALRAAGILGDIDARHFLLRLDERLRATPDAIGQIEVAAAMLREHLGVALVGYGEVDADGQRLVVHRDSGDGRLPSTVGAFALAELGPELIADLARGRGVARQDGPSPGLFVPFVEHGRLVALLFVRHAEVRAWTEHEMALVERVGERLRTVVERTRAEERYRLVIRATRDAIWDYDLVTNRIDWSESVFDLFGYPADAVIPDGTWWEDRIHPGERERVVAGLHAAIAKDESWSDEYRFRRADGSYAHVIDRGTILRDPDGRAFRAIGAILDLSEREEAEAQLRLAQADLMRVSRLTAMGAVASTLAHELNQPLTSAANFLSVARLRLADRDDLPDVIATSVAKASGEVIRAGEIVRRIRRFASTGQLTRRPEPLAELIARAWESVSQLPVAARCPLVTRIAPGAERVEVDQVQIEQVLANLMRNAVEAMADVADPLVEIVARPRGGMIEIAVRDRGPGLDEGAHAHLFEPFRSNKASGLGLGLPLCRTIVEAHGGRIWAEDAPAVGAVFVLSLPGGARD